MNWWVDRHSRVVVRGRIAVALSVLEFAILMVFYGHDRRRRQTVYPTSRIIEEVYRGVKEPPMYPHATICLTVHHMNKKLERVGIAIRGRNQRHHSSYRIEDLRA